MAERQRPWHRDLPDAFRDPAVLTFVAALLAWKQGDPQPPMPSGVTLETLPRMMAQLEEPKVRRAVVLELSALVPHSARGLRRRRQG